MGWSFGSPSLLRCACLVLELSGEHGPDLGSWLALHHGIMVTIDLVHFDAAFKAASPCLCLHSCIPHVRAKKDDIALENSHGEGRYDADVVQISDSDP